MRIVGGSVVVVVAPVDVGDRKNVQDLLISPPLLLRGSWSS